MSFALMLNEVRQKRTIAKALLEEKRGWDAEDQSAKMEIELLEAFQRNKRELHSTCMRHHNHNPKWNLQGKGNTEILGASARPTTFSFPGNLGS